MNNAIQTYLVKNECNNITCLFDTTKSSEDVAREFATVMKGAKVCGVHDVQNSDCKTYPIKDNKPVYKVDGKYAASDGMPAIGRIILPNGIVYGVIQWNSCVRESSYNERDENGVATGNVITVKSYNCASVYMDINNTQGPNQAGADVYAFYIMEDGKVTSYGNYINAPLLYNKLDYVPYNIGDEFKN